MQSASLILESFIEDKTLCDDLIQMHHNHTYKRQVSTPHKRSTDTSYHVVWSMELYEPIERLAGELAKCVRQYVEKYPESEWNILQLDFGLMNVQHYLPEQGFPSWHKERLPSDPIGGLREGVWMLYLNDVPDGGTQFKFQDLEVKAEKGKMVLWPSYWTHQHRGVISPTTEKLIATGWLSRQK